MRSAAFRVAAVGQLLLASLAFAAPTGTTGAATEMPAPAHPKRAIYLFNLADFMGDMRGSFQRLAYDRARDEVYVWGGLDVQIFGETGMQIHSFGSAQGLRSVYALAPLPGGDLVVAMAGEGGPQFARCNYRGEVMAPFVPTGLPPDIDLGADAIRHVAGRLYFLDLRGFRVIVTDEQGRYLSFRDLMKPVFTGLEPGEEPDTQNVEITGFDVDEQGDVLLTVAAQFRAIVISPQGEVRAFGGKGSKPGKFNVAGAIARDERGYFYAADSLRSVIMVFAPDLKFLFELGGRGESPGRLAVPTSIAAGNGKVYVSQGRNRGVSVYKIE